MLHNLLIIIFLIINAAYSQPHFPIINDYVTDLSGNLSDQEIKELNSKFFDFHKKHGIHVAGIIVHSINEQDIERFAYETAELNKLGGTEYNSGILIILTDDPDVHHIEIGYNLYDIFNPGLLSSINRNRIVPNLQAGSYYRALDSIMLMFEKHLLNISNGVENITGIRGNDPTPVNGLKHLLFYLSLILLLFFKKGRGLGTLFDKSALKGRKRFYFDEYEITGFKHEIDKRIDPKYGVFRPGGFFRSAVKKFDGNVYTGKWEKNN